MVDVSVVHLVWGPLGREPVERFVAAYRRHPAGCDHRLVVALNGFADDAERDAVLRLFSGVEHEVFVLPEPVQDLRAYRAAAAHLDTEFVCFLNSYATPLADGWLAKLAAHARRPGVGLVGASGSWQSLSEWMVAEVEPAGRVPRTLHPRRWAGWARRAVRRVAHERRVARDFRPFPNWHVRSNAFMLRRALFLELDAGPLRTKHDAYRFENGRRSMTAQVLARGLEALVVGRDGIAYAPDAWPASRTYRTGGQANLLVADNQTRKFDEDVWDQDRLRREAWETGERLEPRRPAGGGAAG